MGNLISSQHLASSGTTLMTTSTNISANSSLHLLSQLSLAPALSFIQSATLALSCQSLPLTELEAFPKPSHSPIAPLLFRQSLPLLFPNNVCNSCSSIEIDIIKKRFNSNGLKATVALTANHANLFETQRMWPRAHRAMCIPCGGVGLVLLHLLVWGGPVPHAFKVVHGDGNPYNIVASNLSLEARLCLPRALRNRQGPVPIGVYQCGINCWWTSIGNSQFGTYNTA